MIPQRLRLKNSLQNEHGEKVQLSGAEFSLHQAVVNAEGEIIYDADGTPVYDAQVFWHHLRAGTVEDYQNFSDAFEKAYASYGVDLSLFGWKENGQEKSATVTAKTVMDGDKRRRKSRPICNESTPYHDYKRRGDYTRSSIWQPAGNRL